MEFPTKEITEEYAKYVASRIKEIVKAINEANVSLVIGESYNGIMSVWPIKGEIQGHSIMTMLKLMHEFDLSWEEALEEYNFSFSSYYSK